MIWLATSGRRRYLPQRQVRLYREAGNAWRVPHTPQFRLLTYMVNPRDRDNATLNQALEGLRELVRAALVDGWGPVEVSP